MEMQQDYDCLICVVHRDDKYGIGVISPYNMMPSKTYRAAGVFGKRIGGKYTELESLFVAPLDMNEQLEDYTTLRINNPMIAQGDQMQQVSHRSEEDSRYLEAKRVLDSCRLVGIVRSGTKVLGKAPMEALKDMDALRNYLVGIGGQ